MLIMVSLNTVLFTVRVPPDTKTSPPSPVVAPLVKVKLINLTLPLVLNTLFPLPSKMISPDSFALSVISLLRANPFTV